MPSAADATPALLHVPDLPGAGARLELAAADSHYVARVCRARPGESVEATDGRGARATLRLLEVGRVVRAAVEAVAAVPPPRPATLWCGAPEGERADWLVEKLAELGVTRFVPVDCERSRWRRAAGRRERWERLAVAALRQSRRAHLMVLADPAPLGELLDGFPAGGERWLADGAGGPPGPLPEGAPDGLVGLVGPSGGLSPGERAEALRHGFSLVKLSDARLRTETAALAMAALWTSASG